MNFAASAPARWTPGDADFPKLLNTVPTPPKQLYALGARATLNAPCVAIVGTRRPTAYGARVTRQLATSLANAGACVVSGLATGVDGCAHRAALDARGRTAAVLGAGIDEVYPPGHLQLYRDIARHGLVLSEFEPGRKAFKGCFPRRNRIIAGLASVTIVVEAGHRSGALITANYATDMGRTVAAVPGHIDSPQSQGANQLIRDGAHVITSVDDALSLLHTATVVTAQPDLSHDEATLWDALCALSDASPRALDDGVAVTSDTLMTRAALPPNRCLSALTNLELRGLVDCLPNGGVRRRPV